MSEASFEIPADHRYSRHRLIDWWDQEALLAANILVAGVGALGNEVVKNLALLGVGQICIIDFDRIEVSNLSRCVLFRDCDTGRWKAEVAAERVKEINPEAKVSYIVGDLELDLGLGYLKRFNIVVGCLDSINARWALNRACMRIGVPWINGGLSSVAGEVALYSPDHPCCYQCGMTDEMWMRFNERYSCSKFLRNLPPCTVPTTATLASVTGALQAQQAVAWIHKLAGRDTLAPGQKLFFSLKPYNVFIVDLPSSPECLAHERIERTILVQGGPDTIRARDISTRLLDIGIRVDSFHLGYDLATGLECPKCGKENILSPVKKLTSNDGLCLKCGKQRVPILVNEFTTEDRLARALLSDLGVPGQAILACRTAESYVYVELTQ